MTDTTSTRPQMGDEELREILAEGVEKAYPGQARMIREGTWAKGTAMLSVDECIEAMSRVRASLPQPTAGSTGAAKLERSEEWWLERISKEPDDVVIGAGGNSGEPVPMSVYLAAVKGRADFRKALVEAREEIASLKAVASTPAQSVLVEAERNRLADILWARGMTHEDIKERSGWLLAATVVRRGRELAEQEKLDNLFRAIDEIEDEPESAPSQPAPVVDDRGLQAIIAELKSFPPSPLLDDAIDSLERIS